ncbi:hypothetical protein FACS1894126_2810 [Alphaproteobacteria bacterium]|nr:hypothetical protein FACS1894126_2810 [Alphaproteobacteria bacterium]
MNKVVVAICMSVVASCGISSGMQQNIVLRLADIMALDPGRVVTLIGMCGEHYSCKTHPCFLNSRFEECKITARYPSSCGLKAALPRITGNPILVVCFKRGTGPVLQYANALYNTLLIEDEARFVGIATAKPLPAFSDVIETIPLVNNCLEIA